MSRLNALASTSHSILWVQHGQLLAGDGFRKRDEPSCAFAMDKNSFVDTHSFNHVNPNSIKHVGLMGRHDIRFAIGNVYGAECGTAADRELTLADFREIVGNLLTVTVIVDSPTSPEPNGGLLGKKIEAQRGRGGAPEIGVQFSIKTRKSVSIVFSIDARNLIGNKVDTISPSYMTVVNKATQTPYLPWQPTGLDNSFLMPGSTQVFALAVTNPAQVSELIRSFPNAAVVISVKSLSPKPFVYIDLQDLCVSYPDQFVNLDSGQAGCP